MNVAISIQSIKSVKAPQSESIDHVLIDINAEVAECGVSLKLHTDFNRFRDVVAGIPDRGEITSLFNPDKSNIGPDNGFWIEGTDAEGQVVHVQAVRVDDLGAQSIASHWQQYPGLYAPPGVDIDLDKTVFNIPRVSQEISGRVCYHGDLWMHKSCRKFRLSPSLSKFAMMLAFVRFQPDYIYGFIVPKHVRQGLAAVHGYLHIHPWAPQWHIRGSNEMYDDYLVWVSGEELRELWGSCERNVKVLGRVRENGNGISTTMKNMARH